MKQLKTLVDVVEMAKLKGPINTAVVAPYDKNTIMAVIGGQEEGLINAKLYGEYEKIKNLLQEENVNVNNFSIFDSKNPVDDAIASVRSDECKLLMKGSISTPKLLKSVLDKTNGLNIGGICSHLVVCNIPDWNRLLIITDGGLNVLPNLEQKIGIVNNAIHASKKLGVEIPKVGLICSLEEVKTNIPATVDAAIITQMCRRGQIKEAIIDGPLALDNIVSAEAAKKKGIISEVSGCADIIVVPSIEVGNVLGKSLAYFGGSINAGIVVGAKVPIILPSRAGKIEAKWASIALGVIMSN